MIAKLHLEAFLELRKAKSLVFGCFVQNAQPILNLLERLLIALDLCSVLIRPDLLLSESVKLLASFDTLLVDLLAHLFTRLGELRDSEFERPKPLLPSEDLSICVSFEVRQAGGLSLVIRLLYLLVDHVFEV